MAKLGPLEDPRHHRGHLPRAGRLRYEVVDASRDGLGHRCVFLALRHHHDGDAWVDAPNLAKHLDAGPAGHLVIEKNEIVAFSSQLAQGIVTVRLRVYLVTALLENQPMGEQKLDLVVDPEDPAFGRFLPAHHSFQV